MTKTGQENFINHNASAGFQLIDFWQWSHSNLLDNTLRGVLAEFIVARALNIKTSQRIEWDNYDLQTSSGLKIEVKSAAYLQSWKQEKLSKIQFGIQPTKKWDFETNKRVSELTRQADIYVFCLLHHTDKETINPLDLNQWRFYILQTEILNEKCQLQKTITLNSLLKLNPKVCSFDEIKENISSLGEI